MANASRGCPRRVHHVSGLWSSLWEAVGPNCPTLGEGSAVHHSTCRFGSDRRGLLTLSNNAYKTAVCINV